MGNVDEGLKGIAVVDGDIDPCIGLLVVGVNCKDGSKGWKFDRCCKYGSFWSDCCCCCCCWGSREEPVATGIFDGGPANDDMLVLSDDDDAVDLWPGALGRYDALGRIAGELRPLLVIPLVLESVAPVLPIWPLFLWFALSIEISSGILPSEVIAYSGRVVYEFANDDLFLSLYILLILIQCVYSTTSVFWICSKNAILKPKDRKAEWGKELRYTEQVLNFLGLWLEEATLVIVIRVTYKSRRRSFPWKVNFPCSYRCVCTWKDSLLNKERDLEREKKKRISWVFDTLDTTRYGTGSTKPPHPTLFNLQLPVVMVATGKRLTL